MHEAAFEVQSGAIEVTQRNDTNDVHLKSVKIIDLINQYRTTNKKFFSIEISPKTNFNVNYKNNFENLESPIFTSVTWHTNLDETDILDVPAHRLAKELMGAENVLLHLNCEKMAQSHVDKILRGGFTNVLAVRGDTVTEGQQFNNASNLVEYIHNQHQNVCVAVGGYPEKHPESLTHELDLQNLKLKVGCGGDFIITQVCFSATKIISFIRDCRRIGIDVPIIPGIFIPPNFRSFTLMLQICKITVDDVNLERLKAAKDDKLEFLRIAESMAVEMIRELLANDEENIGGIHFFTLNNLDSVKNVVKHFDFC